MRHEAAPVRGRTRVATELSLLDAVGDERPGRFALGIGELDRVLGGGLVAGSVILLGGEPGVGKSTLALVAAAAASQPPTAARGTTAPTAIYVSGEESTGQVRMRADRLGLLRPDGTARIAVVNETDVGTILDVARGTAPRLLVVDSIQTMTLEGMDGPAGSLGQVREAAATFVRYAKESSVPVVLVGHVTKEGSVAGPKTLEHLVDVVLTLEGERFGPLRLLRATKNRFGATDEVGVFHMTGDGLREVADPTRLFLGDSRVSAPGVCVGVALEGSRPLLVEVQTLVVPAPYGSPRRTVSGLDASRLHLLVAVLGRRAGIDLSSRDIYASIAGGLSVEEPALDLPLALALASSARDRPIAAETVATGEVGLLGEIRPVQAIERRLREAQRLGFQRAIVPVSDGRPDGGISELSAATLRDAIALALTPESEPAGLR